MPDLERRSRSTAIRRNKRRTAARRAFSLTVPVTGGGEIGRGRQGHAQEPRTLPLAWPRRRIGLRSEGTVGVQPGQRPSWRPVTRYDSHVAQQTVERAAELARDSRARTPARAAGLASVRDDVRWFEHEQG